MIAYFKNENYKSEKKYKKIQNINFSIKIFDTFVIIATASSSIASSLTDFGLIIIPVSSSIECGLTIGNKVI